MMIRRLSVLILFLFLPVISFAQDIPEGHVFAKIESGMGESEVQKILGKASHKTRYKTGKSWIPGAGRFLNDARRQSWFYTGKGSIVLSKNKYSGVYSVIKINYDPNQE